MVIVENRFPRAASQAQQVARVGSGGGREEGRGCQGDLSTKSSG